MLEFITITLHVLVWYKDNTLQYTVITLRGNFYTTTTFVRLSWSPHHDRQSLQFLLLLLLLWDLFLRRTFGMNDI